MKQQILIYGFNLSQKLDVFCIYIVISQTARQRCSVKADMWTRAVMLTYENMPCPQLLSNRPENDRGDNVRPRINPAKIRPCQCCGHAPVTGWNIRLPCLFKFLDRATDQTESARSAQSGSKDAILRMVNLWGFKCSAVTIWGCFTPKNPKLGVGLGFPMQMKMLKISKTVTGSAIVCLRSKQETICSKIKSVLTIDLCFKVIRFQTSRTAINHSCEKRWPQELKTSKTRFVLSKWKKAFRNVNRKSS